MPIEIIVSTQHNPFLNLAAEQTLLQENPGDTVVMYLWKNRQTVVIGKHQNPYAECHVERLAAEGGHLMRRLTGGGAVYHDLGNLNFSFIASPERYCLEKQFAVLQEAVKSFGLHPTLSGRNDVLCEGRKFSGNAFSVGKNNCLHHGTILIRTDMEKLQRYLRPKPGKLHKHGVSSVESRVVNLSDLADITSENILEPLSEAFQRIYHENARVRTWEEVCSESVRKTARELENPDFLFGHWRQFQAKRQGSFPWGEVEIGLTVDENASRILQANIATDCLQPAAIEKAEQLLQGADSRTAPPTEDLPENEAGIVRDIFHLIYA